ncbi:DUF397 domain-containing protein [Streptomyces geranii]|uniref:DUF397 domain-containing protein n=1 Tax=Streptomyces geranii TaxID=2058923 RepID=UPI000D03F83B|nr:DUF397 domain-containing protein [Streptomyces geranii]
MNNTAGSAEFAAADWFKSSYSAADNECVEVARSLSRVGIRDSKTPVRGVVTLAVDAFAQFVNAVRS